MRRGRVDGRRPHPTVSLSGVKVSNEVRRSLNHWEGKEWDSSILHACNAVDAIGNARYPRLGVATQYKRTLRDSLDIFGAMTAQGIDWDKTRFPIAVESDLPDKRPDIADVLYGIHRRGHGHKDELPNGFELTPPGPRASGVHIWRDGKIELPASAVIGMLAIAVFAPESKGEVIPHGYQISWFQRVFHVSDWWGWQDHFREIISVAKVPKKALEFGKSWDTWTPLG